MDLGQGDYQLSGTDRILTDIAMVPPILMVGIKSTGYKSKRSDRTLTGATLEMEILSQCGESKMRDFKPSPMNHGKGSVAGQLTPVEYNRLTVSETVSIDEPTGGYMEMLENRNSARGYVMALEDERAMEGYLEMMLQGTTLKQKAYGTLASSDVEAETIEQLVSLPWKAVVLRYFEEEMRTTPRIHALVAVPYVRTELQLRFAWCMMGLTREEYDSEERKRSKEEKVFLLTNLRDLIVQEGAAVACAKRRDALCFIRFLIEQISVPALNTCVKMLREGDERTKALFLLAMLEMQQSKPMRVNMKEPEELEPMKKIDEIRRFSNKELRLTKESMGALPKSSEYCGPIKKKSYSYVSGIIGIAYNPFLSEDIRDCFFDYEQAVLLRFWTSRIVTINPLCRTGCKLDRVAFMEEVWTVIQSYGTQSNLKTGLNQPLMREVRDKLDECEGRLSELLIDSATDESEANSPIKMTPQDDGEVVYLSRTRRGTMRSKMVIDKINAMKMKLGSRVMPRRIGKTKVDSEISMKAGNSAKRKSWIWGKVIINCLAQIEY